MLALSPFTYPCVSTYATELAQDLADHSGEAWTCIGRTKNPHGGYIYQLRLKEEYDAITVGGRIDPITAHRNEIELKKKAYPAFEPFGFQAMYLDPDMKKEDVRMIQRNAGVDEASIVKPDKYKQYVLHKFGYNGKCHREGVDLFLPDGEAVMGNWENERKDKNLGPLRILCLKTGATHRQFIVGVLIYHAVLSVSEFGHDHFAHVIPNLLLNYDSNFISLPDYLVGRSRIYRILGRVFRRIEIGELALAGKIEVKLDQTSRSLLNKHLEPITAILSALIDVVNSYNDYDMWKKVTIVYSKKEKLLAMWVNPNFRAYWQKQFANRKIQIEELHEALVLLENLEHQFDAGTPNKKNI